MFNSRSKRRNPVPFTPSDGSLPHLPTPVTHRAPRAPSAGHNTLQFRVADKWETVRAYVKRTLAAPSIPTSSVLGEAAADVNVISTRIGRRKDAEGLADTDEVDEVVVDRSWSEDFKTETNSDAAETASSRHDPSEHDADTIDMRPKGLWALPPFKFLRMRVWPVVAEFYMPRFEEAEEQLYQKEVWGQTKRPSLWASVFFIASWVLGCSTIQEPIVLADKIFYFAVAPLLSIPLLFMCAYNFPYERAFFFQAFLCVSTWSWYAPVYDVLFAYLCGFYWPRSQLFTCGKKDFLSTFYYTSALQAVALFGTSLKRLPATIGALCFLIFSCVTVVPVQHGYAHNLVNFTIFECVLLYMHSQKEQSSRKLFWLRQQLRVQFQQTRKAQVAERQAADSKRRLTSYVRVPLNTALLAVQNMASRPIAKDHEVEFSALEGSLSMMSKVLNDVLDFNRMDSGRLESLSRPYAFHKVLRSLFIPLRLAADARQLEFVTDLDMRIDEVARRAAYRHMDASPEAIAQHLRDQPSGERVMGMVVGDETRLRQIITNLASNACKFTSAGGKLTIRTRLVIPGPGPPPGLPPPVRPAAAAALHPNEGQSLTATALSMHNEATSMHNDAPPADDDVERIVVRIEITDTGSGIPPKDMVECKLFSAFNQTEQGRQQGGKGTGLGLALVRQIVKLSGGRLGLRSKVGQGSTFWVELPLGVGRKAMVPCVPGTPSSQAHGAPSYPTPPGDGANGHVQLGSPGSGHSVTEAVDAAAFAAAQAPPPTTRSSSALHGLMDQGGRFELTLSKYDSHSPAPTRTLGDASTGTEYPLPSPEAQSDKFPLLPPALDAREDSGRTIRTARPTYVPMPSPPSFTLDGPAPALTPTLPLAAPVGLRVLVVDDDALTRMLMTRMLERMGCRVVTAENGEVALQRIVGIDHSPAPPVVGADTEPAPAEPRFAIIFLDNQMPKLSGVKMVERLRLLGRTDFVVGVTGNALLTDQKEYLDAGADHVLTKPVLEASLRSMLALAAARQKAVEREVVL
ncbi:histidine kinase [Mycena filopes]|nr:histidine kinase [Mycena filopes]